MSLLLDAIARAIRDVLEHSEGSDIDKVVVRPFAANMWPTAGRDTRAPFGR
ncbi:hypothetical protein [Sphingomonas sp. GM_Shp_2]|uniref:hypothetical protein n=1 Tax=Sphingomonas sp. GM_Shp_2 TaxID=2937380 RepID=UPI00226A975A|nr:hypothetical protein [Sphingomonas sp. GM_Shp_2]